MNVTCPRCESVFETAQPEKCPICTLPEEIRAKMAQLGCIVGPANVWWTDVGGWVDARQAFEADGPGIDAIAEGHWFPASTDNYWFWYAPPRSCCPQCKVLDSKTIAAHDLQQLEIVRALLLSCPLEVHRGAVIVSGTNDTLVAWKIAGRWLQQVTDAAGAPLAKR